MAGIAAAAMGGLGRERKKKTKIQNTIHGRADHSICGAFPAAAFQKEEGHMSI
jgi:hypothetical protein